MYKERNYSYVFLFFLVVVNSVIGQNNDPINLDKLLKTTEEYSEQQRIVDSVVQNNLGNELMISQLYHSFSVVLDSKKRHEESVMNLLRAIEIRKDFKGKDKLLYRKSLFNLGFFYRKYRKNFKAIEVFESLTNFDDKDRLCFRAYAELGVLYNRIGDFEKSIDYFNRTEDYYIKEGELNNLLRSYVRISHVYLGMQDERTRKAVDYLFKADSLISNEYVNVSINTRAVIYLNLGNAYVTLKKPNEAERYYEKAIEKKKELNDSVSLARLHNNMGSLFLKEKRFDEAFRFFEKGLSYLANKKELKLRSYIYDNLGTYHREVGQFSESLSFYRQAIDLLANGSVRENYRNPTVSKVKQLSQKLLLFDYISNKADYWQKVYETTNEKKALENALADYHLADKLIDIIRFDATEKVSKLFWREKSASLYLKAVKVCYDLDRVADAYYFMEKNKALLLLENLSDQQAKTMSDLPQELIEQEMRFKQEILSAEKSGDQNTLFDIKRSYERFRDSIETQYPTYSALRKEIPILSYEDHRKTFANDETATIQYIIGTEEGFVLVSSKEKGSLHHIKDVALLNKDIRETMPFFRNPLATEDCLKVYIERTHSIFKRVFPEGCYERLKGKQLIIAADHSLQNIPFEALVTKENATFSVSNLEYLIQSNAVYYVYSFSYLYTNNEKERQPTKSFIGFAPKDFTSLDLASLNNSIEEVNAINGIFHEDVFLNEKASKDSFLKEFGQYNIVHLATHSGMDDESHPWLAFRDAKVSLNEIYTTQNNAELVVLSACKTSQGEMVSGEGVMSLARGFFFSGTNTVLSSLWSVNDGSTEKLMVKFYAYLNQGYTKSAALHQAKLDYLNDNEGSMASPFFWSSFILIGNSNAVPIKNPSILMENSYIILIILIGLLLFFYWRKKKK